MKGRICFHEIFQKYRYFQNNISGVLSEAIFSKYNEHDFLMPI